MEVPVMIETQCEEDKECRERVCVSEQRISWSRQLGKVTYKRHFLSDRRSPNAWDTLSRKGYAESCNPFQANAYRPTPFQPRLHPGQLRALVTNLLAKFLHVGQKPAFQDKLLIMWTYSTVVHLQNFGHRPLFV